MSKIASKSVCRGSAGLIRWFSHDASKSHHSSRGNMRQFQRVLNPEAVMAPTMEVFTRSIRSMALKMGSKEVFYKGNFSSCLQLHLQRTFSSNADLPPPQEIGMPSLPPTMTEENIATCLKKEGDQVNPGDVIYEVETDKAIAEMESMEEDYLAKIVKGAGSQGIPVGKGRKLGHDLATKHGYPAPSLTIFNEKAKFSSIQETAVSQCFLHRCLTTAVNPVAPVTHGITPETNLPPRIKFKRLDKTARHIMQILDKEAVEEVKGQRDFPDIKPGHIIQLKLEVPENKRRITTIKGIVIARRNAGLNSTFRIRRLVAGIGVESLLPLYSPNIKEIKVLDKKKVRRAKLYYLREKMNPLKK